VRTLATVQTRARDRPIADRAGRRPQHPLADVATSATPSPNRAPRACSMAGRWWASRSRAAAARARCRSARRSQGAGRTEGAAPDIELTQAFDFVTPVAGGIRRLAAPAVRRARRWPCWWCGCSCATGAPPSCRPSRCRCR
jgi:hypothetical protein